MERLKLYVVWLQSDQYQEGKKLVPIGIKKNYTRWVDLNKDDFDVELKTFSRRECLQLIKDNYDESIMEAFMKLSKIRMTQHFQCDLFRFLLLFLKGGLYVDIDQVPLVSLKEMGLTSDIDFMSIACTFDDVKRRRFSNAFIYVKNPGSDFIMKCIERTVINILMNNNRELMRAQVVGGPYIMGDVYREVYKKNLEVGLSDHDGERWLLMNSKFDQPRSSFKSDIEWWSSFYVQNLEGKKVMNDRYIGYYTDRNHRAPNQLTEFD